MNPLVSVVVVAHRSREHLAACLRAVKAQAGPLELIVVDNASADATPELVRAEAPGARVIENGRNLGFAAGANQAAREARGLFLLLLNPDATLGPGAIGALMAAMEPGVGLAGARLQNPDGSPQPSAWPAPSLATFLFDALLLRNFAPHSRLHVVETPELSPAVRVACLSGACLLVRRECWDSLGGFDERFFLYHEDWDLCLRAGAAGWTRLLVPIAKATHVLGGSAFQDRGQFLLHYHQSREAFIRKHWSGAHRASLIGIHRAGLLLRIFVYGSLGLLGDAARHSDARHHASALRHLLRAP